MFSVGDKLVVKTDAHSGCFNGKTGVVTEVNEEAEAVPIMVHLDDENPAFIETMNLLFGSPAVPFDVKELELLED